MKPVTIHHAKSSLPKLIEKARRGEEIVIARGNKLPVSLVPIAEIGGERRPGAWRGKVKIGPKFFEPLPLDEFASH